MIVAENEVIQSRKRNAIEDRNIRQRSWSLPRCEPRKAVQTWLTVCLKQRAKRETDPQIIFQQQKVRRGVRNCPPNSLDTYLALNTPSHARLSHDEGWKPISAQLVSWTYRDFSVYNPLFHESWALILTHNRPDNAPTEMKQADLKWIP